jgi:hypothetical protein
MLAFAKYTQDSVGPYPPRPEMLVIVQNLHFVPSSSAVTRLSDDALESVLVPLDGLGLVDLVGGADLALAPPALGDALTGAGHADIEVHAVDTVPVS